MKNWKGSVIWSHYGNNGEWEHVSISPYKQKIKPSWDDMCYIKDIFFAEEVIQIHPKKMNMSI